MSRLSDCDNREACDLYQQLFNKSVLSGVIWEVPDKSDWGSCSLHSANWEAIESFHKQWGLDIRDRIGVPAREVWESLNDGFLDMLLKAARGEGGSSFRYEWAPGNQLPLIYECYVSQITNGYVLVAYREVTEEVRRQEDLDWFAGAASHDLLSPLRGAMIALQNVEKHLLRSGLEVPPRAQRWMSHLRDSVTKMETLVDAFLSYVRSPGGNGTPFRLRLAVADALKGLDYDFAEVLYGDLGEVRVQGNREAIAIVMTNLLENAHKYRSADRPLKVRVGVLRGLPERPGRVRVFVEDNGIGVTPDHITRIFSPRVRLHGDSIPGSGLGLATCRRILERHRMPIWAESDGAGRGTTFWFELNEA